MEPKARKTSVWKRISKWNTPLFCVCLVACLQGGCATVQARFGKAAHELRPVFPSTQLAAENVPEWLNEDELHTGDMGTAIVVTTGAFIYALVELLPAVASDIVLFPIDAYYVRKRSAKERRENSEVSKD